jgi:DNA polymerase
MPAVMADPREHLQKAARQLIETERLFAGEFIPAGRNPLPASEPARPKEADMPGTDVEAKAATLKEIEQEARNCERCPLHKSRTQAVFGEGSPDADLVFVGEAPGQEEDRQGRPFVGRAGQLLDKMIQAMGLGREDVYITNILKSRPPNNRSPAADEIEACWDYLVRQLQIIEPRVIVTLGNPATQTLLDTRTGITRLRGQWQKLPLLGEGLAGIDVMPTFHPAYLLRQYTVDNRRKVWEDLQKVMDALGVNGSESRSE